MQFDAKKESSSSDPKLKDKERLHTLGSCSYLQPTSKTPTKGWSEVQPAAQESQESLPWCRHPLIVLLFVSRKKHLCTKPLGGQMFEGFWHSIQFVFECESVQAAQFC